VPKGEKFKNTINKRSSACMFIPNLMKTGSRIFVGSRYEPGYDNIAVTILCKGIEVIKINITFALPFKSLKGRPHFK
jgi:hypothetical protein